MPTSATAAVLHDPHGQFTLQEVELDDPRSDEILVRIEASGVCHTDEMAKGMLEPPMVWATKAPEWSEPLDPELPGSNPAIGSLSLTPGAVPAENAPLRMATGASGCCRSRSAARAWMDRRPSP